MRRDAHGLDGDRRLVASDEDVLQYERRSRQERVLVALNIGSETRRLLLPAGSAIADVLASTHALRTLDGLLAPNEGLVLRLENV